MDGDPSSAHPLVRDLQRWIPPVTGTDYGEAFLLQAALDGAGLAYLSDAAAKPHLDAGRLVRVLERYAPASGLSGSSTRADASCERRFARSSRS